MEKKINIIVTFFNCEKYIEQCLNSILKQKYENYHIFIVNDASTDNSDNIIKEVIGEENKKISYFLNKENKTALENIVFILSNYIEEESIWCLVDGDDFLIGNKVFKYVNEIFTYGIGGENKIVNEENIKDYNEDFIKKHKVLFCYGSAQWSNGDKCFSRPYSKEQFLTIKKQPYLVSHLRCFMGSLWKEMISQFPDLSFAKDNFGNFYKSGYDTILCIPMLQLCGFEHTYYNEKPIYYYRLHENNDHTKNQKLQWSVHTEALKKTNFKKLNETHINT